jgi:hypothetical protein
VLASKLAQENKGLGRPSVKDSKGECPANDTFGTLENTHFLRPLDVLELACNIRSRCSLRHPIWLLGETAKLCIYSESAETIMCIFPPSGTLDTKPL